MTAFYRAKTYLPSGAAIVSLGTQDRDEQERTLKTMLEIGTGGHLEEHIESIGWVIAVDVEQEVTP